MNNPIERAVAPQKAASVAMAVRAVRSNLDRFTSALLEKNLTEVAPFPHSGMSKAEYKQARARYELARRVMITHADGNKINSPLWADAVNADAIESILEDTARIAGEQFDAYVAKLTLKVGACDAANVTGDLWVRSLLTVRKGDKVERWSTQQILNVSSLGTLFNQWPTRLLK